MRSEDTQLESELIRRFRDGDEAAFRVLLKKCRPVLEARVDRFLSGAIKRRVSVADILQEAQIIAFNRRGDLEDRGAGTFRKWLLGIVELKARQCVQHHADVAMRSVDQEITRGYRPDTAAHVGKGLSPSQVAMGTELEGLTRQAMEALSDDYKQVLHLTCKERLTLDEISVLMSRSTEAVRKLQARAILKFTEVFNRLRGEENE